MMKHKSIPTSINHISKDLRVHKAKFNSFVSWQCGINFFNVAFFPLIHIIWIKEKNSSWPEHYK